ncbi:MAG: tryptophan--tRNA ligase [Deltaproteobacteria bacterium]|nr:MAG: tryptophan--tRNA ligase [Deltaproteobacteria bacterium]
MALRSLTGIKPTGEIHLGNYLGAIRPGLALQDRYTAYYFVADYHALTSVMDPQELRLASRTIAATFLAFGLDPSSHVLFMQSAVPEVCELTWILSCQIPPGVLDRGHAVKAARDAGRDINVGTWMYPVLMAADILLYDSDVVPVGSDQRQHVEVARDIAIKVNHRYGDGTLRVPEVSIQEQGAAIPGLDGRKMSKSYQNVIGLWQNPKKLRKQIMRIVTDSRGVDDPKDPDSDTTFQLYALFAEPEAVADLRQAYLQGGLGYGHAKAALFEVLNEHLALPRDHFHHWMDHPSDLDDVLDAGAVRARAAARETLDRVRSRVGLK